MKNFFLLLLILVSSAYCQEINEPLSGTEKAFLYHHTRKTEVLNRELFHLFEFTDSIPYITDTLPDYTYIEKKIVQSPDLLVIHHSELKRKPIGLVYDLSIRYALWELGQVLQYRNSTAEADQHLKPKLKLFEEYVREEAPQSVIRTLNNGEYTLAKTVRGYYSASLTTADKLASIINSGYNQLDQMLILNAIMRAEEMYVSERSIEVFNYLTGSELDSRNLLSALGDGGNWATLETGISTPYSVGLPDEIGLFRFRIEEVFNKEREEKELKVQDVQSYSFDLDKVKETVIHTDVFGYHPERQTTISIQSGGKSYVLYGKNEHRLVSPDSSYGEGTTYWRLMSRLEHFYIANLKEDLYGKRGYEYQINVFEEKIEKTKLNIKKTEFRLDELRHTPEGKPKIKKKKIKKKDLGRSDQDGGGHPTSKLSRLDKKKNIEQNRLLQLNGQLDAQKGILRQLIEDMEKAHKRLIKYETLLDKMKKTLGYEIMSYEQDGCTYLFADGAYFDYRTQNFIFPPDHSSGSFTIKHISFGEALFDDQIDENFVHFNIAKRHASSIYTHKKVVDSANDYQLTMSDSIQIVELFNYLKHKDHELDFKAVAGGIGRLSDNGYQKVMDAKPVSESSDQKKSHNIIRYAAYRHVDMEVYLTVYSDQYIPDNFEIMRENYNKVKEKYPVINEIDFYTAVMAQRETEKWVIVLTDCANKWIASPRDRKTVLKKIKKIKAKKVDLEVLGVSVKIKDEQ